jgi:hypothetical protein
LLLKLITRRKRAFGVVLASKPTGPAYDIVSVCRPEINSALLCNSALSATERTKTQKNTESSVVWKYLFIF